MSKLITLLLFIVFTFVSIAQPGVGKADKEFDLSAYQKASSSYLKELKKNPNDGNLMVKLATSYLMINEMDEAVRWFEKASKIQVLRAETLLNYGKALQAQGAYDKAQDLFRNYAEGNPQIGAQYVRNCEFAQKMKGVKSLYEVKPEYLNTAASEFAPTFFKEHVVFASSRNDLNAKGNSKDWTGSFSNRLFISSIDNNNYLTSPQLLRAKIKNASNEGPLSYAENAGIVCYTKNNFTESNRQIPETGAELSLYFATIKGNGDWEADKAFPYNGSGYSTGYPCLADDGNTLYFASDRPDGFGGFDIYVSFRVGDTWSVPENLGPTVNTPGNEISPYRDEDVLYFSSDLSQGLGGFDIFKAEGTDDKWTKIFHLGNDVNSSYDDYSFIFSAKKNRGYFCSNRPGKGKEDLYRVVKITDNFTITVFDEQNQPIKDALVDLRNCNEKEFRTGASGQVFFEALKGFNCEAIIRKSGYETVAFNIRSSGSTQAQNVELVLRKVGENTAYIGRVIDADKRLPKEGVYVAATNLSDGSVLEMLTNSNGEYFMDLLPSQKYTLRFSMIGYAEAKKEINTGNGTDRGILGEVSLVSSGTSVSETVTTTVPEKPANNPPPARETPAPTTETKTNAPTVTYGETKGFAVQIAAVDASKKINMEIFNDVKDMRSFYLKEEKGKTKVRIGVFEDYESAESMREKMVALGYKRAFIVKERRLPSESGMVSTSSGTNTTTETKYTPVTSVPKGYMVRLASYKNPKFFNPEKVHHYGPIEQRASGEFTIMLITGFSNLAEAQQATQSAIDAGFKGAHIVVDEGGKLVKVK